MTGVQTCALPILDEDQMGELAKRKVRNKESIKDLLDHLDSDVLRELVRELLS